MIKIAKITKMIPKIAIEIANVTSSFCSTTISTIIQNIYF
jgi:hypothetical protein